MIATALAIGSGGIVGFSLGLVGGGGSILATPLLLYVVGVSQPHIAIGTSALAVSVNAFASMLGHARSGNVRWICGVVFAVVGAAGALAGSTAGKAFDGDALLFLFGILMVLVGAAMLRPRTSSVSAAPGRPDLRTCIFTGLLALLAGAASGFFGVGGGFLIVPALMLATGMPTINAIGTSLLAVGAFGLATAANYAIDGLVDWVVAAEFIGGGVAGGILGTMLANRLSLHKETLNRIFAGLVFVVAAYVLYRSGRDLFG